MIVGSRCWDLPEGYALETRMLGGRYRDVYVGAADSLYLQLAATARRSPKAMAVVDDEGRRYTYGMLARMVDDFAGHLVALGLGAGDRIALLMRSEVEYVVALYAINRIGAVAVSLSTKLRAGELASLVGKADVALLICDSEYEGVARSMPVDPDRIVVCENPKTEYGFSHFGPSHDAGPVASDPEAPALMMFTSGTTSASKAVLLTNFNVVHADMTYAALMGTTPEDACLICLPIYYVTGLIALLAQFVYVGATVFLQRRFDPEAALTLVREEGVTYLHAAPAAFALLLSKREEFPELPSLRVLLSGSSRESEGVMAAYHEWLPRARYQVVYGLTESSSPALLFPGDTPSSPYPSATGYPVPGVQARIVAEGGGEAGPGELGELWIRGTCVTDGYFRRSSTALKGEGWFSTGDVAYANENGLVWVVDRIKDMINRGGEKVWCRSVEEKIEAVDGVAASCVARLPDERYGEVPVAGVVPEPGAELTEDGIIDALRPVLAKYEVPERIVFMDAIPLTAASKPDRRVVTRLAAKAAGIEID